MSKPLNRSGVLSLRDELSFAVEAGLVPLISGHDRHICLLDMPDYPNVGDHMIALGQLAFLEKAFPRSKLSFFDHKTYSPKCDPLIDQCSIILLIGGGNFGDIWPSQQRFREAILTRFAHKRIIQLPQSISFSSPARAQECAAVIAGAADFHLMVRDTTSEEFARAHFSCPVQLLPNMAFCLPKLSRLPAVTKFACLLRSDKEAVADHAAIAAIVQEQTTDKLAVVDWTNEQLTFVRRLDWWLAQQTRARPHLTWPINRWMLWVRKRYALSRLEIGIAMLSAGQLVVTDRLHAHVLACLLGIPNFVFNSLDGKVAGLYRAWTHREPLATLVESPDELRQLLSDPAQAAID